MAKGSIYLGSRSYECNLPVDQIAAEGSLNNSFLIVPVAIEFVPEEKFEILAATAELRGTDKNFRIAESFNLLSSKIYNRTTHTFYFKFSISDQILKKIEDQRKENLPLNITFMIQYGVLFDLNVNNNDGKSITKRFLTETNTAQTNIQFVIEQSFWINKILKTISYPGFKLIELPLFNEIIPSEYTLSLTEFEEARKYFTQGDYDKTVAHCRSAIEPFKKKLPEIKEFVKSKSEFEWVNSVLDATDIWLEKLIKATSGFTSKTHHVPSVGHFGRSDAEIIMMITTGLLSYIGKIGYKIKD